MTLYESVAHMMHEGTTLFRYDQTDQNGIDLFLSGTEHLEPVRLIRMDDVAYNKEGREVRIRARLLMPHPAGDPIKEKDQLVMDGTGEIFRVFAFRVEWDRVGDKYIVARVL